MLAHQIKSDCDLRLPAVDASTTFDEPTDEKSMSPGDNDERDTKMRQEDVQQQQASCSPSRSPPETSAARHHEHARPQEELRRRQKQAVAQADKTVNGLSGKPARNVEARLLVRRREAGALIGKRGANIKRLRQIFKESAFNIPDTGNGPERIVCINTCSLDQLAIILTELTQLFQEKQQGQSARSHPPPQPQPATFLPEQSAPPRTSDLIEVKLLVNASHAGLLIGIGGQSIRKLRSDSKAAIKIYEMCCPLSSERVCAIKAKPPVVVSTIKMILEMLDGNAIKGTHKPYDALNFDLFLADKYGGYAADDEPGSASISSPGPPPSLAPSSLAPAGSPLDFLQQLHQVNSHTLPAQSALILQNQAAQLLAAAAAATSAAATGRVRSAADCFGSQRLGPPACSSSHMGRMSGRASACDRYAAAAAMAAEKYHSIIKAGQQAAIASRYHPYQAHPQARGYHQAERHYEQQHYAFRRSSAHGLTCSGCEASAAGDHQATSSSPASCEAVDEEPARAAKEPLA